MRTAIFSDIHGNALGLHTALIDIGSQRIDQMVCLGDAIQGGPQPAQVVARLRELQCPVVMGNADYWMLTGDEKGESEPASQELLDVRAWSLSQLSDADRAFIGGFQPTVELDLGGGKKLLCFHGSPTSFNDIILPTTPEDEVQRSLGAYSGYILTGGHTHMQFVRRLGEMFFFNPGSVGFAYSHQQPEDDFRADLWAEYAILTVETGSIGLEFRRIPYDRERMIEIYRTSGRPYAEKAARQYQPRGSA
jgi:predicted phosphodiesterase